MKKMLLAAAAVVLLSGCNPFASEAETTEAPADAAALVGAPTASASSAAPAAEGGSGKGDAPAAAPAPAATVAANGSCSDGIDRHMTLVNNSGQTLMYFYASPPSTDDWEEDILGSDVLTDGSRFEIDFNTDTRCVCEYDTKAVFADDSEEIGTANVCNREQVVYR